MTILSLNIPVIGILRGVSPDFFPDLMAASFEAGLEALEVTTNTPGAFEMISRCRGLVPRGKWLGMGTVRNLSEARQARGAGAMFMVSPNTDPEVISHGLEHDVPVVAGAFTPTEVYRAFNLGAALVKVFPCGVVGPGYIRELRGPFDEIPLVAVGGVNRRNLAEYFRAGAAGVGVGSELFGKEALRDCRAGAVASHIKSFLDELAGVPRMQGAQISRK